MKKNPKYQAYIEILNNELLPAMGCTEPIAIAYCASLVRKYLGAIPTSLDIIVSGNIIKNVKSVTVPHTNGAHGIEAAAGIGILVGNPDKELEVISHVEEEDIKKLPEYLKNTLINIIHSDTTHNLYIEIIGKKDSDYVRVIIKDSHINVTLIEKNKELLFENKEDIVNKRKELDLSILSVKEIIEFADEVDILEVKEVLERQITYNMAIAEEGITNNYGANIGKTILKHMGCDTIQYIKALAASGSDARMNGCDMPVVINSGSGNQGLTTSVPVIAYARRNNIEEDTLYRALVVANLCTIHMKKNIGKLSAYCGVVMAGAASGAGIAYLEGGKLDAIAHTLVNSLAMISGVVCDGAKSSCAAKIASSVEAGILGYYMYKDGNQFYGGDGIVKKGVENTIKSVGELARKGMCETDKEIIHIMLS